MSGQCMIWAWAQADKCDQPTHLLVLLKMADIAQQNGMLWPSQGYIAKKTGLSPRTVRSAVKALEDNGLIITRPRAGRSDLTRLVLTPIVVSPPTDDEFEWGAENKTARAAPVASAPAPVADNTSITPTTETSSLRSEPARDLATLPGLDLGSNLPAPTGKPKRAKSVKPPSAPPGQFEKWWDEYPNKVSKKEAIAAFDKAWALLSLSHAYPGDVLWNGLQVYKRKVAGWEKRHIRHAATWLNGENWDDEEQTDGPRTGSSPGGWGDQRTNNIRSLYEGLGRSDHGDD